MDISSSINASIVNQIPVKKDEKRQRDILLGAIETLEQTGDDKATLNYSAAALQKIETMNSLRFPEIYKKEIKKNLNDLVRKAQRLIKDKKL